MTDGIAESVTQPSVADGKCAKGGWRVDVADASSSILLVNPNFESQWLSHSLYTRLRFRSLLKRFHASPYQTSLLGQS